MRLLIASIAVCLASVACAAEADPFFAAPVLSSGGQSEIILSVPFQVRPGYHLYADEIRIDAAGGIQLLPRDIPAPKKKYDPILENNVSVYGENTTFRYAVVGLTQTVLSVTIKYQGCSEQTCFMPQTRTFSLSLDHSLAAAPPVPEPQSAPPPTMPERMSDFSIAGRATGYLTAVEFIAFLDRTESGKGLDPDRLQQAVRSGSLWLAILLIVLGGLALNLTPCVLPMIPINIAIIGAGSQAGSKTRGLALGAMYGAGIAVVYGALGIAVVTTGARFGTLNASPWFNIGVALLFLLLSLGMFGMIQIDINQIRSRFQSTNPRLRRLTMIILLALVTALMAHAFRSTVWSPIVIVVMFVITFLSLCECHSSNVNHKPSGDASGETSPYARLSAAFVMGGVAALLAGACVAPVIFSVLLLSSDLYAQGNPAGLLLPFLLGVGMALPWPFAGAGLSFLPKPGRWMQIVKYLFGSIILLIALGYGIMGTRLIIQSSPASRQDVADAVQRKASDGWLTSLDEALTLAALDHKPVFVDCWASWCKNCLAMEKTTFRDPAVNRRLDSYIKVKFRAEKLDDPAVKPVLDYFSTPGLPTYVILHRNTQSGASSQP